MITDFQSPNLQREIIQKKKNNFFSNFALFGFVPGYLPVILYQLTKSEAPSCYSFRGIMITTF